MNNRTAAAEQFEMTHGKKTKEPKLLTSGSFAAPRLLSATIAQPLEPLMAIAAVTLEPLIESFAAPLPTAVTVEAGTKVSGTPPSAVPPPAAEPIDYPPPPPAQSGRPAVNRFARSAGHLRSKKSGGSVPAAG